MKLIDDTIGVNTKDMEIFMKLLSAFAGHKKNPALADACWTILDALNGEDGEGNVSILKNEFEIWSQCQIKFK